mmetsp:Transcript_6389/g.10075  ORF Transcript_6389/g.10075 Transcript_6389/m.10075 type:complete len:230 (-) Transcript_6389:515-1204(-)
MSRRDRHDQRYGHRDRDYNRGYDRPRARGAGGAEHLARIHGTEEDRVNCPFYYKIGACRHGDTCSRLHTRPTFSQTVLIKQIYQNPLAQQVGQGARVPSKYSQHRYDPDFEEFFIDIFEELSEYGELSDIAVCDNLCDHLLGNIYIKFYDEQDAAKCVKGLTGRYYAGKQLEAEFSPVTDFLESRCRQYDKEKCDRGGNCNFMHIKPINRGLERDLYHDQPYRGHRSHR